MKLFGSTAVILLVIVVKDVLSDCPKSGCECGAFCVDINNKWCNSNNDKECSCKKGCLMFDHLMKHGDSGKYYCADCVCNTEIFTSGAEYCVMDEEDYCLPSNLTLNVDYPALENKFPNCEEGDYDYED